MQDYYIINEIRLFEGLVNVTNLPICPASHWDKIDGGQHRRNIIQRNSFLSKLFRETHLLINHNEPCRGGTAYVATA